MQVKSEKNNAPIVSVLIPTFNRPEYLYQALGSVLRQSYTNLQIIVINDGGQDVGDIVQSFNDPRLVFIDRKENHGKAFSLNEALRQAEGKYIAYLDDDDIYYPEHIETLVDALEGQTDCQVAYSDMYKVYCRILPDGNRQVLSKVVQVSRDFDRFFMLYFNHVLHVCLMHRRDLIEKTGYYNEKLSVLIDWDMTRRLVFFSDFLHVNRVTGEYYHPMGECDRISVQRRKDKNEYLRNVQTIRTTRPAKPWPKIDELSVVCIVDKPDEIARQTISLIQRDTFYPHELHLFIPELGLSRLNVGISGSAYEAVGTLSPQTQQIDSILERCQGKYVAIVPSGFPLQFFSLENPLYALLNCPAEKQGFELEGATSELWAAIVKKSDLIYARRSFPNLPVRESLKSAGIVFSQPQIDELPFHFDNLLYLAFIAQRNGNWHEAAQMYQYIAGRCQNELWMKRLAAKAFFKAGDKAKAAELCGQINSQQPTVDTLLLEGKLKRQENKFNSAIELLTTAENTLKGQELIWT